MFVNSQFPFIMSSEQTINHFQFLYIQLSGLEHFYIKLV